MSCFGSGLEVFPRAQLVACVGRSSSLAGAGPRDNTFSQHHLQIVQRSYLRMHYQIDLSQQISCPDSNSRAPARLDDLQRTRRSKTKLRKRQCWRASVFAMLRYIRKRTARKSSRIRPLLFDNLAQLASSPCEPASAATGRSLAILSSLASTLPHSDRKRHEYPFAAGSFEFNGWHA